MCFFFNSTEATVLLYRAKRSRPSRLFSQRNTYLTKIAIYLSSKMSGMRVHAWFLGEFLDTELLLCSPLLGSLFSTALNARVSGNVRATNPATNGYDNPTYVESHAPRS